MPDEAQDLGKLLGFGSVASRARTAQRRALIADRRRSGRAGDLDEWLKAVKKSLGPERYDDIPVSRLDFLNMIGYLNSVGRLHQFTAFLPDEYHHRQVADIVNGCHPSPRYFASLAHDFDFMDATARADLERKWGRYFSNTHHDREGEFYNYLRHYNEFAAIWARRLWRKHNKKHATPDDRAKAYEKEILHSSDMSDTLSNMMRLVINEGLSSYDPEQVLLRVNEGDPFADDENIDVDAQQAMREFAEENPDGS